jgi:regulator of cell morphogenesis and NO signaling
MTTHSSSGDGETVAAIVADSPELARVFESFGIDFCCNGDRPLSEACATAGIDEAAVRDALADAREDAGQSEPLEWEHPSKLIDHIVAQHHDPMREELPALEQLVRKVRGVHEENHPELASVEEEFLALAEELREHTAEEEEDVFPIIRALESGEPVSAAERETLRAAIDDLEADHDQTGDRLGALSALTDEYAVPEDACASYRSMLQRLEAVERDTHMHVHKENNLLFPAVEADLLA